jgi:hypothetical protein
MEKVNDKDAYAIEVTDAKGDKSTEYYDVQSGFLVKKVETENGETQAVEYSDYKEVAGANGYKLAHTLKMLAGPMTITAKTETVEINKNIPDSEFN